METSLMSSRRIETCEDNDKELIAVGEMCGKSVDKGCSVDEENCPVTAD